MLRETLAALQLKVTIGDRTEQVPLKPGDLVRYETHFGKSLTDGVQIDENGEVLGAQFGLTELSYLAYLGAKRAGMVNGDFDGFLDVMDDIEIDGAEKPGPLDLSPASSPP
jgi:hypothetical protein